jgi:hypothetical protein
MNICASLLALLYFDGPHPADLPQGPPPPWLLPVFVGVGFGAAVIGVYLSRRDQQRVKQAQENRIVSLEKKTEEEPEKVRFAWDLARVKLEAYFDRNLNQVMMIFYVAVFVMAAGFSFIVWGLYEAILHPENVKISLIASASGIITEFISVTFMVIYRSTMLQATQFVTVLERINTVGMAVQILDAMDTATTNLKDSTRVDLIRLLLASEKNVPLTAPPADKSKSATAGSSG